MTSIHRLEVVLAFFHEIEWSQSQTFLVAEFGAISVSNVSGKTCQFILSLNLDGEK